MVIAFFFGWQYADTWNAWYTTGSAVLAPYADLVGNFIVVNTVQLLALFVGAVRVSLWEANHRYVRWQGSTTIFWSNYVLLLVGAVLFLTGVCMYHGCISCIIEPGIIYTIGGALIINSYPVWFAFGRTYP